MDWIGQAVAWVNLLQRDLYAALGAQIRALGESTGGAVGAVTFALALGAVHALTPGHGKAVVFTYFVGGGARVWAGAAMALKVAAAHVLSAGALVAVFGSAVMMFGRPTGPAQWLQATSYAAIALTGAWLLYRAVSEAARDVEHVHAHAHSHTGLLPFAVGLLPCPMTMLILTFAAANATVAIGVVLSLFLGIGIAATIAVVGSAGILVRRGLLGRLDPEARLYRRVIDFLQIASALVILALGAIFLVGTLRQ
jgi:ABC-type nickel/cobalt efflux system permease component RcnA